MSQVRETARRAACGSNQRQIGLGVYMYADAHQDEIPPTVYVTQRDGSQQRETEETMVLRGTVAQGFRKNGWDGIGWLYGDEYLEAPKIFYCPSHHGDHSYAVYEKAWQSRKGAIVGNFHYRGEGPDGNTKLSRIEPANSALLADGMRTINDYNHRVGTNVLRADMAVRWFADHGAISSSLARSDGESNTTTIDRAWNTLDEQSPD